MHAAAPGDVGMLDAKPEHAGAGVGMRDAAPGDDDDCWVRSMIEANSSSTMFSDDDTVARQMLDGARQRPTTASIFVTFFAKLSSIEGLEFPQPPRFGHYIEQWFWRAIETTRSSSLEIVRSLDTRL